MMERITVVRNDVILQFKQKSGMLWGSDKIFAWNINIMNIDSEFYCGLILIYFQILH